MIRATRKYILLLKNDGHVHITQPPNQPHPWSSTRSIQSMQCFAAISLFQPHSSGIPVLPVLQGYNNPRFAYPSLPSPKNTPLCIVWEFQRLFHPSLCISDSYPVDNRTGVCSVQTHHIHPSPPMGTTPLNPIAMNHQTTCLPTFKPSPHYTPTLSQIKPSSQNPFGPALDKLVQQHGHVVKHKPADVKGKKLRGVASAQLEANLCLIGMAQPRVFHLASDLI
jgi:hypothetical protein